eukprot:m.228216 g.228216  ORF g.228216 m.228216 type:complete len:1020 (+) comp17424_c0_seq1:16-3075(+)
MAALASVLRRAGAAALSARAQVSRSTAPQLSLLLSVRAQPVRAFASKPVITGKTKKETFLSGTSASYIEDLYDKFRADPSSVHASWREYFALIENQAEEPFTPPPELGAPVSVNTAAPEVQLVYDHIRVQQLIRAYQTRGHRLAKLDPLGLDVLSHPPPELTLETYGFGPADLERKFVLPPNSVFAGDKKTLTLGEIVSRLQSVYCQTVGFDYMHIQDRARCDWLRLRIEKDPEPLANKARQLLLHDLVDADCFEESLKIKYPGEKRFGLEGCEALIPALRRMVSGLSHAGVETAVIGMAHRGRLNVLHNVLGKDMSVIFKEFKSTLAPDDEGSGDVMYHRGTYNDVQFPGMDKPIHLSMMPNPSHLEAVGPVVLGRVRAEQQIVGGDTKRHVGIIIHGDAALAGQGVCTETMGMSDLRDYTTGGTIHMVINNQIGFTTSPADARSSEYCTDLAKMTGAPVLHVNADSLEAVARCVDLAVEWRQTFGKDVIVDLVCYRRNGHNETDMGAFTHPLMYKTIESTPAAMVQYGKILVDSGVVKQEQFEAEVSEARGKFAKAFDIKDQIPMRKQEYYPKYWTAFKRRAAELGAQTGVAHDRLISIVQQGVLPPPDFNLHPQLRTILERRVQTVEKNLGMDWATAEHLAFGSLLQDGIHVRLSGQDVERGTFSQRHHVLHDQKVDGQRTTPLSRLATPQAPYTVSNSHLSEFAVLGFELGYSYPSPFSLVCWEAQFGDFVNGASPILDNFLSSGERKWGPQSGLVVLLPHGYEGMGPEHSSGRLERFLQLSDDDESKFPESLLNDPTGELQAEQGNWAVANCTTPANYFHILRRQIYRPFRKPLILMTPKSLLRHPRARSLVEDIQPGSHFQRLIPESDSSIFSGHGVPNPSVTRLVLCSGKVYYDLLQAREALSERGVAIARVEQIAPFPYDLVAKHADDFPNAEIVWCQEEPRNMGSWAFVRTRIETALKASAHHNGRRPRYVGRAPSAATATGDKKQHTKEQQTLVEAAVTLSRGAMTQNI